MDVPGMEPAARMRAAATARSRQRRVEAVARRNGTDDSVAISDQARLVASAVTARDEARLARIARIKQEIQAGTYATPEKLHIAVERMIASVLDDDDGGR